MNSTNGTYINGERLKVHTRVNINNGDILKFAAYEFKVSIVSVSYTHLVDNMRSDLIYKISGVYKWK